MSYILVIGSINMDLVVKTRRMPKPGETIKGETFETIPGGKGANQAVAASRMGANVKMVGAIGADAFGQALIESLVSHGVDGTAIIEKQGVSTGTATIIVDQTGDNRIIVVPGANGCLIESDINKVEPLIAGASLVILQFEIPIKTVDYIVQAAQRNSVPVVLNPAPAYNVSDALLSKVKYLVANESEAELLAGCPVTDVGTGYQAAELLCSKGIQTAIITLGKQGALVQGPNVRFHMPAKEVAVVDTTAAGDTFIGAFAAAYVEGAPIEKAIEFAIGAGTLAVTSFGAQSSIPDKKQVLKFIAEANNNSLVQGGCL